MTGQAVSTSTPKQKFTVEKRTVTTTDYQVEADDLDDAFAQVRNDQALPLIEDCSTELVVRDVPLERIPSHCTTSHEH